MRDLCFPRLLAGAAVAILACGSALADGNLLATAPIDASMFREGEVRRSAEVYGAWTLICDAIPKLKHRFCSLKAGPVMLGAGRLDLTVSTGDDGRAAALLRLPLGLSLPYGVRLKAGGERTNGRRIPIALCSTTSCEAAWTLSSGDLAALNTGNGITISVQGWSPALPVHQAAAPSPVGTTVYGQGFSAAIAASLR